MTPSQLHVLQHAFGIDQHGRGRAYRHHFCTSEGGQDWTDCQSLVEAGMMVRYPPAAISGGDHVFVVTVAGEVAARIQSPPPPKLTRSQCRYRRWLNEDGGLTFGEWLKSRSTMRAAVAIGWE